MKPRWNDTYLSSQTEPSSNPGSTHRLIVSLGVIVLSIQLILFTHLLSVNILYFDQWLFSKPIFDEENYWKMFTSIYGPSRQGIGLLVDYFIIKLTSWNVRVQSLYIALLLILSTLMALNLKRRLFGQISILDISIPLLMLTLAQYENIIVVPNANHSIFALFLMSILALCLTSRIYFVKHLGSGIIVFLITFSGFGVFCTGVFSIYLCLDIFLAKRRSNGEEINYQIIALLMVASACALFFYQYEFAPYAPVQNPLAINILTYFKYIFLMYGYFLGFRGGAFEPVSVVFGFFPFIMLVGILFYSMRRFMGKIHSHDHVYRICFIFSFFTLVFSIIVAIGRISIGEGAGQTTRYMPLLLPGFLTIYFTLYNFPNGRFRNVIMGCFICWLCLKMAVFSLPASKITMPAAHTLKQQKEVWVRTYLSSGNVDEANAKSQLEIFSDKHYLQEKLQYLKEKNLNIFNEQ